MPYHPEQAYVVALSESGVSCQHPGGLVEAVPWDELRAVLIETTDAGPLSIDVFWILVGDHGGCVIPQGATGEDRLLDRLQALAGFDNDMLIRAMQSSDNERFLCWERPPRAE